MDTYGGGGTVDWTGPVRRSCRETGLVYRIAGALGVRCTDCR